MAIGKRRLRPGRRTALAAGLGALALLAATFAFREDLVAWFIGYRFIWMPEGVGPRWGNPLKAAGQFLVVGGDVESDGIWSMGSGEIVRLDLPPHSEGVAKALAINGKGHVVGVVASRSRDGTNRPFHWTGEGGMRLLASQYSGRTIFKDLNEQGEAVGSFEIETRKGPITVPTLKSFRWTAEGGFHSLGGLPGGTDMDSASAINESGWIAGVATAADRREHPVLWIPPDYHIRELGLPPEFSEGAAVDVNDAGVVLVNLSNLSRGPAGRVRLMETTPFLWTGDHGYLSLPIPEGHLTVVGEAIDREGTVLLKAYRLSESGLVGKNFLVLRGKVLENPRPREALECEYHGLTDQGWLIGRAWLTVRLDSWSGFVAWPVR